jgi:hypothetical protein
MHPITDKAEVAIDFPDKFYMGGFGLDCAFEARAEDEGVLVRLVRPSGEKRAVEIHLHHTCSPPFSTIWRNCWPGASRSTSRTGSRC